MRIVVTTPTGNVGSHLVPLLVQAGEHPVLVVRDRAKLSRDILESTEVIEADLGDADAVVAATRGADAIYWVDPTTEDDDPIEGFARVGAIGAAAVRENGIPRVVFQSSVGAEGRTGFGEIDGLARTEEYFDDSGASVTHLRCGYFFSNLLMEADSLQEGAFRTTMPIDRPLPWVAPQDIAAVAASRLLSTSWSGRHTLGVHGPEDLSFADVARIVGEAIGRRIEAQQVSDEDMAAALAGFGLGDKHVEGIIGMSRGLRDEGFAPENPRSLTTTTPTRLAGWAYANLRALG